MFVWWLGVFVCEAVLWNLWYCLLVLWIRFVGRNYSLRVCVDGESARERS